MDAKIKEAIDLAIASLEAAKGAGRTELYLCLSEAYDEVSKAFHLSAAELRKSPGAVPGE